MTKTVISFGSNMGNRLGNLRKAVNLLTLKGIVFIKKSDVFETKPVGVEDQPYFLNACALVETALDATQLLDLIKETEGEIGRIKRERWGPREIDIDILLMEDLYLDKPGITVPHPRLHERSFVLFPLLQIAPDWVHPVLKKSVRELWEDLADRDDSLLRISAL